MEKKYAALFCRKDSAYKNRPHFDVWDADRDATKYDVDMPVVAHPPCRAWGMLQHHSFRSFDNPWYERVSEMGLAIEAMKQVFKCGGILEHPKDSRLWNLLCKSQDFHLIDIDQYDFGHVASKPTKLLIFPKVELPPMPPVNREPSSRSVCGNVEGTTRMTTKEREHTPEPLIDWFEKILEQM